MNGVSTKSIFSGERCVRTSFSLEDPRFAEALPDKIQIQIGRFARATLLPQVSDNLANKGYAPWRIQAVETLVVGILDVTVLNVEPIDQVNVLCGRGQAPTVAVCFHNDCWMSGDLLDQCHTGIYWAFATLLTAGASI